MTHESEDNGPHLLIDPEDKPSLLSREQKAAVKRGRSKIPFAKKGMARAKAPGAFVKQPPGRDERRPPIYQQTEVRDGVFRQAIETGRTRVLITATVLTLAFGVIGARLVDVTAMQGPMEPRSAKLTVVEPDQAALRAPITDRNGILLATNLSTVTLFADPKLVMNPKETAYKLAAVLPDLDPSWVEERLKRNSRYVWLHRTLTPEQQYAVNRLGLPGIDFERKETRVYPHGPLVSHVLGYTDVDNNGIAGLEKRFDDTLNTGGEAVRLSIDVRVQHVLRDELKKAVDTYSAIGAAGIVMDARNGEVVAMSSLPDFDPNHPGEASADAIFNRATLGVYELGSTFKIFNTAMALDSGVVGMTGGYDASEPIRISRFTISDYHAKNRWLSVPEIFIYSSNIGSAKMALDVGPEGQRAFLERIGFFDPVPLELPEVGRPQKPDTWRPINTMTISYGHGISVSPMHLVSGVAAMINGGTLHRPTLLQAEAGQQGKQVISARTSEAIRALMHLNGIEGSGKRAAVDGYYVGGKTGTAEKVGARGTYARRSLISSFVGAFPMHDPQYVVYVVLDEPKGTKETHGFATGGWVAAPSVGNVIRRAAPLLNVDPALEEPAAIRQQLAIVAPQLEASLASLSQ